MSTGVGRALGPMGMFWNRRRWWSHTHRALKATDLLPLKRSILCYVDFSSINKRVDPSYKVQKRGGGVARDGPRDRTGSRVKALNPSSCLFCPEWARNRAGDSWEAH